MSIPRKLLPLTESKVEPPGALVAAVTPAAGADDSVAGLVLPDGGGLARHVAVLTALIGARGVRIAAWLTARNSPTRRATGARSALI